MARRHTLLCDLCPYEEDITGSASSTITRMRATLCLASDDAINDVDFTMDLCSDCRQKATGAMRNMFTRARHDG